MFPFVSFTYFVTCYVFMSRIFFHGGEGGKTSKAQVLFFVLFLCYCLLFGVAYLLLLIWLMTDRRISRWSWGSGRRKHARWKSRRRRRYVWHAGRWWLELNRIHTQKKACRLSCWPIILKNNCKHIVAIFFFLFLIWCLLSPRV